MTVLDNSPGQLAQDQLVADREGLEIKLTLGDLADLSVFENESFALIVQPSSKRFVKRTTMERWRPLFLTCLLSAPYTMYMYM